MIEIDGKKRSVLCDWRAAALLRDNVMHWLEEGTPSGRFPAIHALAEFPSFPERPGPTAAALADELSVALPLLADIRGPELAIGLWTRATMTGERRLPCVRGTVPARFVDWGLPMNVPDDLTLAQLYRPFLRALRLAAGRRADSGDDVS